MSNAADRRVDALSRVVGALGICVALAAVAVGAMLWVVQLDPLYRAQTAGKLIYVVPDWTLTVVAAAASSLAVAGQQIGRWRLMGVGCVINAAWLSVLAGTSIVDAAKLGSWSTVLAGVFYAAVAAATVVLAWSAREMGT